MISNFSFLSFEQKFKNQLPTPCAQANEITVVWLSRKKPPLAFDGIIILHPSMLQSFVILYPPRSSPPVIVTRLSDIAYNKITHIEDL